MQEDLLQFDENEIRWTDKEVFAGFFTRPKEAFDYIIEQYYNKYVIQIMVLYGITRNLNKEISSGINLAGLISAIIFGGLFGWLGIYLGAIFLYFPGKWFGGKGDISQIARIISYLILPNIIGAILMLLVFVIYFSLNISLEISSLNISSIVLAFFAIISVAGIVWTFILLTIGISRLQDFSVGIALATIIIGFGLLVAIILGIGFLFAGTLFA